MSEMVLALYDCRSKQEYIYRTSRIREISGGSALLARIYDDFILLAQQEGISFMNGGRWRNNSFSLTAFESSGSDAETVYSGGGNLMILYKDRDIYIRANRLFSRMLLDRTYTITAVAACTPATGDFIADRESLYAQNALNKSTGFISRPCAVLPFTQVDSLTYMPVVAKNRYGQESLSMESILKYKSFARAPSSVLCAYDLEELCAEKGRESLLAVIYIDGNNMGARLMKLLKESTDYDSCINAMRTFSVKTDSDFVDKPITAIEKLLEEKQASGVKYAKYRRVIAGGDEITLICNARLVPELLDVYFRSLDSENSGNYACAGVAIFHSHAPFADVYKIAEQCCESGKKQSRQYQSNANFIDFHFCRAGITNDMETVRERQEDDLTARPYRVDGEHNGCSYCGFISFAEKLKVIKRANIKELGNAIIKSNADYRFEAARINSRYNNIKLNGRDEKTRKMIFDIAQVYDLWFAEEEQE